MKQYKHFNSKDDSLGEIPAALDVAGVMKAKINLGMGLSSQPRKRSQEQITKSILEKKTIILTENTLKNLLNGVELLFADFGKVLLWKYYPTEKESSKLQYPNSRKQEDEQQTILKQPIALPIETEVYWKINILRKIMMKIIKS